MNCPLSAIGADVPARAVAWLALSAPTALSGQFIDYDDPRLPAAVHESADP